jgi:hypothetical protein
VCYTRCHWRCLLDVQYANAVDALQASDDVEDMKLVSCGGERPIVALNKPLDACKGPYHDQHCMPANAYTNTYSALQQKQVCIVTSTLCSFMYAHLAYPSSTAVVRCTT